MPKATVTVRELKNKDTGIDLSVTSYREIPGLVRSTFEYQIVVVSSLSCFKLPSHKESDVVQFTLFKKFADFEDLRAKLNEAFSGTALPPLAKKSIIVNEAVIKERRNNLDVFLKFISGTARIVTSSHVLTFLGVEAQKAKRFASGETEGMPQQEDEKGEGNDEENKQEGMASSSLFEEEEEEEDGGDFLTGSTSSKAAVKEEDFFSTSDLHASSARDTSLFESQDLKRELTEEDEKDFAFIPDAIITKREAVSVPSEDPESELLNVDEDIDLDKLLTLEKEIKQQQLESPTSPQPPERPQASRHHPSQKPSLPTKPKPGTKPVASAKPAVPSKPGAARVDGTSGGKPAVAERPVPAPRKVKAEGQGRGDGAGAGAARVASPKTEMSSDDIMQYIAANAEGDDADLDLFS